MNVINLLMLLTIHTRALSMPSLFMNRRGILSGTFFAPSLAPLQEVAVVKRDFIVNNSIDYYAHWSVYGTVPPPIEKTITYEELLTVIENREIIYFQIAVQHDNVIATTVKNHRWTCPIKDKDFPQLLENIKDDQGNIPLTVLPIDQNRQKIRNIAQYWLALYILRAFVYDVPNNIRLLNECNSSMTNKQKMLFLLENQKDIMQVLKNLTDFSE